MGLILSFRLTVPHILWIIAPFNQELVYNKIVNPCSHHAFIRVVRIADYGLTPYVKRSVDEYWNP